MNNSSVMIMWGQVIFFKQKKKLKLFDLRNE